MRSHVAKKEPSISEWNDTLKIIIFSCKDWEKNTEKQRLNIKILVFSCPYKPPISSRNAKLNSKSLPFPAFVRLQWRKKKPFSY